MSQILNIYRHINSFFSSCSYILEFHNNLWIIDPGDSASIINICQDTGKPIEAILLTHAHYDHIYGLNDFIILDKEYPIITNDTGKNMLNSPKLNLSKYHDAEFRISDNSHICIFDSDKCHKILKSRGFSAESTPGHNPSCLTFFDDTHLFSGDAYIPGIRTVVNLPYSDKEAAIESEKYILELAKSRIMYPGHPANSK